nr:tRNA-dihydrouridine synthase family protein [Oceanivirga salmonicida]
MSGYTDFAYRQIMKKFNPDLMYCEMINSNLLIQENYNTLNSIMRISDDENTGVQLFGSDIQDLYNNFIKLNELGYKDLLLNLGCPQPKILKNGAGANMLHRIDEINHLLSSLKEKNIKISLKIRLSEYTAKYFEMANKYEIPYLCIHTRTKEQLFKGNANHEITEKLSNLDRNFKFIANGNIHSLEDYQKISKLNIDGVMLARGVVGNPHLIKEIKENRKIEVTLEQTKKLVIEHLNYLSEDKGEQKASIEINKFLKEYFKNIDRQTLKDIILDKNFETKIEKISHIK